MDSKATSANIKKCRKWRELNAHKAAYKLKNINRKKINKERSKSPTTQKHVDELRKIGHQIEFLRRNFNEVDRADQINALDEKRKIMKIKQKARKANQERESVGVGSSSATSREFQNFNEYIQSIEARGLHKRGYVKVIRKITCADPYSDIP